MIFFYHIFFIGLFLPFIISFPVQCTALYAYLVPGAEFNGTHLDPKSYA